MGIGEENIKKNQWKMSQDDGIANEQQFINIRRTYLTCMKIN